MDSATPNPYEVGSRSKPWPWSRMVRMTASPSPRTVRTASAVPACLWVFHQRLVRGVVEDLDGHTGTAQRSGRSTNRQVGADDGELASERFDCFDQAAFGCESAAGKHATETFDLEVRPTHEEVRVDVPGTGDRLEHLENRVVQQPVLVDSFDLGGVALRFVDRVGSGRIELPGLGPQGPDLDPQRRTCIGHDDPVLAIASALLASFATR